MYSKSAPSRRNGSKATAYGGGSLLSEADFMTSGGVPKPVRTYSFSIQFAMFGANPGDLFARKARTQC